jgi:hypothetical protein
VRIAETTARLPRSQTCQMSCVSFSPGAPRAAHGRRSRQSRRLVPFRSLGGIRLPPRRRRRREDCNIVPGGQWARLRPHAKDGRPPVLHDWSPVFLFPPRVRWRFRFPSEGGPATRTVVAKGWRNTLRTVSTCREMGRGLRSRTSSETESPLGVFAPERRPAGHAATSRNRRRQSPHPRRRRRRSSGGALAATPGS